MPKISSGSKERCRFTLDLFDWVKANDYGSLADEPATAVESPSRDRPALSQGRNPSSRSRDVKLASHGC